MKNHKYSLKKIKKYFSDSIHANKKNLKILINGLIKIGLLIAVTAIVVHFLTSSETLSDYAKNDPSAAYGTSTESSQPVTGSHSSTAESSADQSSAIQSSTMQSSTVQSSTMQSSTVTESSAASSKSPSDDVKTYKPGFTSSALTSVIKNKITGVSFPEKYASASGSSASDDGISYDELRYLNIRYIDFDGNEQNGEMICNKAISDDLLEIFYELYSNDYRIDKICLIDDYGGDDESSMTDDNTSCFNYRTIAGKKKISMHAKGLAVDINPLYNPSVTYSKDGSINISPASGMKYADRTSDFPYKINTDDLAYRLFTEHGFTWGGNWNSSKDYQHFEKKF